MSDSNAPVFVFTELDARAYLERNNLISTMLEGEASELRDRLIAGVRALVGVDYNPPVQPVNPDRPNGPWGFIWDDISDATGGHVDWDDAQGLLNKSGEVEVIFEPAWLPAFRVRPRSGSWPELTETDAYLFDALGQWIIAIDHEGYGPFLLPLQDRERLLKLVHPIQLTVVSSEDG